MIELKWTHKRASVARSVLCLVARHPLNFSISAPVCSYETKEANTYFKFSGTKFHDAQFLLVD
jgi:hypothetical protein